MIKCSLRCRKHVLIIIKNALRQIEECVPYRHIGLFWQTRSTGSTNRMKKKLLCEQLDDSLKYSTRTALRRFREVQNICGSDLCAYCNRFCSETMSHQEDIPDPVLTGPPGRSEDRTVMLEMIGRKNHLVMVNGKKNETF